MKSISEYKDSSITWNEKIIKQNSDFRQIYEWGEVRKKSGWQVNKYIFNYYDQTFYLQELRKRLLGFTFQYFPGLSLPNHVHLAEIKNYLLNETSNSLFKYLRFDLMNEFNNSENLDFKNLNKVKFKRTGSNKLVFDLLKKENEILSNMKIKWRRNFNRSKRQNLSYQKNDNPNPDLIYKLGKQLQIKKKFGGSHNDLEIKKIFTEFKDYIFYIESRDEKNNVLGFRAAIIYGDMAWDFYAVTTNEGRKRNTGYFLLGNLIFELKKNGFKKLCFLGEDPTIKPDIFKFKKDVGAELVAYPGEYEASNANFILSIINFIIYLTYTKFTPRILKRH